MAESFIYKGTYSIILFTVVDENYNLWFVDIGANRRASGSTVFRDSKFNQVLQNRTAELPENAVFGGDDVFLLRFNLLKPHSRKSLSEKELVRLSRARRISENTFGILVWRFGVFLLPINLMPDKVDSVVWAACAIHNCLARRVQQHIYHPDQLILRTQLLVTLSMVSGGNRWGSYIHVLTLELLAITGLMQKESCREMDAEYFVGEGAIPWQWRKIGRNFRDVNAE